MKQDIRRYFVSPSVAVPGRETVFTVVPREGAFYFSPDVDYHVSVTPMHVDRDAPEPDYHLHGEGGVLRFTHIFSSEGLHELRILPDGDAKGRLVLQLYAIGEDLADLIPMKGDFHLHTCRSDGKEAPAEVAAKCRENGFDCAAITDHNRYFPSEEAAEAYAGLATDLLLLRGEEVHTPTTNLHIVHVGGKRSVTERYVKAREEYEAEVDTIASGMANDTSIYRRRMAMARWAVDQIHAAEGLAILPHPYWIKNIYNINDAMLRRLFAEVDFDAFEIFGAQEVSGNNLAAAVFAELRENGLRIPVVGNSDSHGGDGDRRFGRLYTVLLAADRTREAVMDAIRAGRTAAVEMGADGEYRVLGSYRMVATLGS